MLQTQIKLFRFVLLHTDIFEIAQIWHILAMFTNGTGLDNILISIRMSSRIYFNYSILFAFLT